MLLPIPYACIHESLAMSANTDIDDNNSVMLPAWLVIIYLASVSILAMMTNNNILLFPEQLHEL